MTRQDDVEDIDPALESIEGDVLAYLPGATPPRLADRAAQAVRALNHVTVPSGGYAYPAELYSTVGALTELAAGLAQVLRQAAGWLEAEQDAGRVVDVTRPQHTAVTVAAASDALDRAQQSAAALASLLADAHSALSDLARRAAGGAR